MKGGGAWACCGCGARWCSGRAWFGFGMLNRCEDSSFRISFFKGFLSGLVSPNCGGLFVKSCSALGTGGCACVLGFGASR